MNTVHPPGLVWFNYNEYYGALCIMNKDARGSFHE